MSCHVDQDITPLIGHQPFATWGVLAPTVCHKADEVLHRDLVPSVVDLDIVSVEIEGSVGVVEDGAWEGVAWVAGHIVRQHENDLRVRNSEALDCTI